MIKHLLAHKKRISLYTHLIHLAVSLHGLQNGENKFL